MIEFTSKEREWIKASIHTELAAMYTGSGPIDEPSGLVLCELDCFDDSMSRELLDILRSIYFKLEKSFVIDTQLPLFSKGV